MSRKKIYSAAKKVIKIATQVFLSGFSLRKNDPRIADNIGAVAIIIKVLATFVFWIETTKAILVTEKVKT